MKGTMHQTENQTQVSTCGCPENEQASLTRRTLFRIAGAAGLITATTASNVRVAVGAQAATAGGVLVVLSLRGGFDGLSAIAPIGDPGYAAARPSTKVPASLAKRVDSRFGLHPAMKPLFPLWDSGDLGAVHAVGQASPTRSHFAAMEEMERAAPSSSLRTGWIDRTLGVIGSSNVFTGTAVGGGELPQSLAGPHSKFALRELANTKLAVGEDLVPLARWRQAITGLQAGARPEVKAPLSNALKAMGVVAPLRASATPAVSAGYPKGELGTALHDVAQLIKAGIGLRVASVEYGNWDMHSGMGNATSGWMFDHLTELSTALAAFAADLGTGFSKVTLITLSEFGRRVGENASNGLDHGHGNAVLVMGGGITGGAVRGRWPGLAAADLVDGDLAGTTDYRSIVSEVLTKRCGVPSGTAIFPGFKPAPVGIA
jgi:uncharacterized protein (DUF1501 family)